MASHMAYLPLVSSLDARKRYTSPTTAMVRPSAGVLKVGWCVMIFDPGRTEHFLPGGQFDGRLTCGESCHYQ